MKLKETPSTTKPCTAKSEENLRNQILCLRLLPKKSVHVQYSQENQQVLGQAKKKSSFHPIRCLCKHHLPVLFSPLLHWQVQRSQGGRQLPGPRSALVLHAKHGCHRAEAAAGEPWELAPCHNHSFGCSFLLPRRHQAGEVLAVAEEQLTGFTPKFPPHTGKGTAVSLSASARET